MFLIKEITDSDSPILAFSRDIFHQAQVVQTDRIHVLGKGFSFDLEKVNNADYNPTYFTDRWKGQKAYFPYNYYDENATNSLFLPFLKMFSQIFIEEANEYTVVLTGLILKYTEATIYIKDDRIRWFYEDDERLRIVESFPEKTEDTLTIGNLEQDLIFDKTFKTMGPIGAFHNVFFLQGHGVFDLSRYKYADVILDKDAGIGSVLNTLSKCSTAMREIGLELITIQKTLGQFKSTVLDKYFSFNLAHTNRTRKVIDQVTSSVLDKYTSLDLAEDADGYNTVLFPSIAALKSTAFIYLTEATVDLRVIKGSFLEEMDEYTSAVFRGRRTLGVLIRGTDYINLFKTGTRHMSTPEEMVPLIDKWMKDYDYEEIFLATEDADILKWMKDHYKDKLLAVAQERHSVADLKGGMLLADLARQEEDPAQTLEEVIVNYFYALYMLSQCDAFICSGYCNGYDLVMHFNKNKFEHVYLFQKGDK